MSVKNFVLWGLRMVAPYASLSHYGALSCQRVQIRRKGNTFLLPVQIPETFRELFNELLQSKLHLEGGGEDVLKVCGGDFCL